MSPLPPHKTGPDNLFEVRALRQRYGERMVLAIDRLDIARGSITAITGPNGSGKSTLMRLLAFLETPTSGEINFLAGQTGNGADFPRRQVTLLLQSPYILKRSVFRNVAQGLRLRGETDRLGERVAEAMELVGLDPAAYGERAWFELSGGEAQRVSLASRLILRPRALLLDEPTSSLDTSSASLIQAAALRAREKWGTTIVVASHDRAWLSAVADREFTLQSTDHAAPGDGICAPSV